MALTTEAQAARAIGKALNTMDFDPDAFAYAFSQGTFGVDSGIQLRMADVMLALGRTWAGWHASGYAKNSNLAGVCEMAYVTLTNAGVEI